MSNKSSCAPLHFAPPGAFARDVNIRARQIFKEPGEHRYGNAGVWLRGLAFLIIGASAYTEVLTGAGGFMFSLILIAIAALCAFMLIVQLGHDASHGSLSKRTQINKLVVFATFAILGVDGALWRDRHVRLHHQVVNLPGTGIDADSVSLLRLAPDKPWHPWHRLQPLYGPVLYAIGHIHLVWLEDFASFRSARLIGRREFTGRGAVARFALGKILHAFLFLLLPAILVHPALLQLAVGYLFASSLIAISFVVLVIGTHVSDLAAFPQPDEAGWLSHDWAVHQLATSVDWSPTSSMAALFSGGANAHVAHHLFPGYNHRHMAALSEIVRQTAADHRLPYHATSFAEMVRGHWRHLVVLSRPSAACIPLQ